MNSQFRRSWQIITLIVGFLMSACTPGVHGTWFVAGEGKGDSEHRVSTMLMDQGFIEWKPSPGSTVVLRGRLFGHQQHPVSVTLVASSGGLQIRFEEHAVDRISSGAAAIYMKVDASLKSEFGTNRVVVSDVPKGLAQTL